MLTFLMIPDHVRDLVFMIYWEMFRSYDKFWNLDFVRPYSVFITFWGMRPFQEAPKSKNQSLRKSVLIWDMTKTDPTLIRKSVLILDMTRTDPTLIFQYCMSNVGTIWGNISRLIQVSVSDTQKCKKFKWHLLSRRPYPGHITEEGGTRRHPGGIHLRFPP